MKILLSLVCLVALTLSQTAPACQICLKVPSCPKELFADTFVDPLYSSIIKQVNLTNSPSALSKTSTSEQSNYTFTWPGQSFLAIVNLNTRAFKIMALQQVQKIVDLQNDLGVRTNTDVKMDPNDLVTKIDTYLRKKYFNGVVVKCLSFKQTNGGYSVVYQKQDGTTISFDVNVQYNNNNLMISETVSTQGKGTSSVQSVKYQTSNNGGRVSESVTKTSFSSSSSSNSSNPYVVTSVTPTSSRLIVATTNAPITATTTSISITQSSKPVQSITPIATPSTISCNTQTTQTTSGSSSSATTNTVNTATPVNTPPSTSTPLIGSYTFISQPLNDPQVQSVIKVLIAQYGNIMNSAILVSAEKQLVNGFNYRLTLSFDQTSTVQYVIVVYKTFSGSISITSQTMINAKTSYSFTTSLTATQATQLPYFNSLQTLISAQLGSILTSDTVLDQFFKDQPYYQLVYHNSVYKQIVVIVQYDILLNTVKIISQQSVLQPAVPAPQPSPKPTSNLRSDDGCQQIQQNLRLDQSIQDYLDYLASSDSRCSRSSIYGIFWNINDHNLLSFRYKWTDGSVKKFDADYDYVQYAVKKWKIKKETSQTSKIANCLIQQGNVCTRCAFKYFLNGGQCKQVQDECNEFDYNINQCQTCYHGYYLDVNKICQKANYLCQSTDGKGNCLTCYKNYRLNFKGRCIFIAQGADEKYPEQQNNPLCSNFSGLKCNSCVQQCYQDQTGTCKIPDVNCDKFDPIKQICLVCMQKYELSSTSKLCISSQRY